MSGLLGWTWDARTVEFVKANGVPAAPAHPKFVAGNPPLVVTIYAYENRYRGQ